MKGITFGTGLAVVLRIGLTFFVALLMEVSFLKIVGGLLILWIAVKLFSEGDGDENVQSATTLWKAIQVILIADLTMSVDNVLAVAGAAGGNLPLLIFGLCLSIPIVIFASQMLSSLMERYPVIVLIGAAILGRVGADMIISDPAMERWFHPTTAMVYFIQGLGMIGVVLAGKYIKNRRNASVSEGSIPEPAGIRLEKELIQP
jgi:YjbE family integral membrane protein